MDANVERLHRALVQAIRRERGESFDQPVTVSQIYQQLLPYRTARTAVGFEMNADYEYALLRLLAGEGDLARLEPAEARESLRLELESPNPNVSLFRNFANCDVWIAPASGHPPLDDEPEVEVEFEDESTNVAYQVTPGSSARVTAEFVNDQQIAAPSECSFCGHALPDTRLVNFCPHCGSDLTRRPCPACGEILESKWRFCVSCGAPAAKLDRDAN